MFELLSRHFWLLAFALALVNCWALIRSVDRLPLSPPQKKATRTILLKALLVWNLPWSVMGLGIVVGGVPDVWDYFRPCDGNLYVLAWFALQVLALLVGMYWMLLKDGADVVASYCEASTGSRPSSTHVKVAWGFGMWGMLGALALMCLN